MTEHREDLSTADLAGQPPAGREPVHERVEDADLDRDRFDGPDDVGRDGTDRDGAFGTDRDGADGGAFGDRDGADRGAFGDRDGADRGAFGDRDVADRDVADRDVVAGRDVVDDGAYGDGTVRDDDLAADRGAVTGDPTDRVPAADSGPGPVATGPVDGAEVAGPAGTAPTGVGPTGTGPADTTTTTPTSGTTGTVPASSGNETHGPLLGSNDAEGFRARWTDVQTGFVDEPRAAVEKADGLVAELMQHLAKTFADERSRLEGQWDSGDDVATDELRAAFQRYRSFFERLLAT